MVKLFESVARSDVKESDNFARYFTARGARSRACFGRRIEGVNIAVCTQRGDRIHSGGEATPACILAAG